MSAEKGLITGNLSFSMLSVYFCFFSRIGLLNNAFYILGYKAIFKLVSSSPFTLVACSLARMKPTNSIM